MRPLATGRARIDPGPLGALQAALVATGASVVGALVGIGLPALSFSVYNGSDRGGLPPVPLVVPWEVPALLILLPVVAALLSGLPLATRHPAPTSPWRTISPGEAASQRDTATLADLCGG